jgi:hypothetical protein
MKKVVRLRVILKKVEIKKVSRKRELNSRPFAYEATALPLSYSGYVEYTSFALP